MKVGIITDELNDGSGIGRYVLELIQGLEKQKLSVEKISGKRAKGGYGDVINHVITLPYLSLIEKDSLDLLHAATPITALSFPIVTGVAKVITYHDLTSLLCKECGSAYHVKATARFYLKIGKFCDKIIAVSSQTKEELVKYFNFPENKITVINLGVDEKFKSFSKIRRGRFIVGYLGDLNIRKRIDYLVNAFKYLKDSHPKLNVFLFIYGKGADLQRLGSIVGNLKLNNCVQFRGYVPENNLVEIYNSFDVFVMPSEWEGFCLPILEAQKCGVPVVIREDAHISEEVNRFCLKAKSEEDMADKIFQLFMNDGFREEIINKGLKYSKQFSWNKTVRETIKVYEEVLQGDNK